LPGNRFKEPRNRKIPCKIPVSREIAWRPVRIPLRRQGGSL